MPEIQFENIKEQSYAAKESLRAIKTNIQFLGDDIQTILFTSSIPDEGKSTVVINLARSIADSGKKILVIDADIRKSVLIGRLKARDIQGEQIYGLSHYLSGQKTMEEVLNKTNIPRVHIIFSGPSVINPTEILEKNYFAQMIQKARKIYDYILIDCPPLGAAIDAAVIAKNCDGAIIVVGQDMVGGRMVSGVKRQLEATGIRVLGGILNKVKTRKGGYYGSYYGSYYGNYYRNDSDSQGKQGRK